MEENKYGHLPQLHFVVGVNSSFDLTLQCGRGIHYTHHIIYTSRILFNLYVFNLLYAYI